MVPPPVVGRPPSPGLVQRFAFDAKPAARVYVDLEGALKSEAVQATVTALVQRGANSMDGARRKCMSDFLASARELVVGIPVEGEPLVLVRYDAARFDVDPCLAASGMQRFDPSAATAAPTRSSMVVAVDGDVLVAGPPAQVRQALTHQGKGGLGGLELGPDQYARAEGAGPNGGGGSAALEISPRRFRLAASIDVVDEAYAQQAQMVFSRMNQKGGPVPAELAALVSALQVQVSGKHIDASFTLEEAPAEQARDLATAVVLASSSFDKYLVNAKTAEAKNTVGQIAKNLVAYYESETPTGARPKLIACPAVPKTVPKGEKYRSTPADWKAWAPLKFEMSEPQYFQYEVKLDKTKKRADVIAHGDLDGDGKVSTFRLSVTVPAKKDGSLQVDPTIEEIDPAE